MAVDNNYRKSQISKATNTHGVLRVTTNNFLKYLNKITMVNFPMTWVFQKAKQDGGLIISMMLAPGLISG